MHHSPNPSCRTSTGKTLSSAVKLFCSPFRSMRAPNLQLTSPSGAPALKSMSLSGTAHLAQPSPSNPKEVSYAHQLLPITYDNIEAIAAAAFAKSRDCIKAIQMDVLHNIRPLDRVGFERLIKIIEARQIFKPEILEELDVQMDFITREIDKSTTVHQHRDDDECNVLAPACSQETRTTERANELGRR